MAATVVVASVLLANLTHGNITSNQTVTTSLPEASASLFALQIGAATEAPLAASPGNNLNDIGGTTNPDVPEEISISTIYSRNDGDKKYKDDSGGGNLVSTESGAWENKDVNSTEQLAETVIEEPLPLVWDTCVETTFRDGQRNLMKAPDDMEVANSDFKLEVHEEMEPPKSLSDFGTWKKREVIFTTNTWLGKYNSLKGSRSEERRQQRPESIIIKKITESAMSTTELIPTQNVKIIPITREIFKEIEVPVLNVTQKAVVTEISVRASYTEDWFEAKDRGKIRFSGLPQRETYLIPALKLEAGFHPFAFMSDFFTVIYPFDFPVGE